MYWTKDLTEEDKVELEKKDRPKESHESQR